MGKFIHSVFRWISRALLCLMVNLVLQTRHEGPEPGIVTHSQWSERKYKWDILGAVVCLEHFFQLWLRGFGGFVWNNWHQLHFVGKKWRENLNFQRYSVWNFVIHSGFVWGWLVFGSTIAELRPGLILPGVQLELGSPQSWLDTSEEGLNFQMKLKS